MKFKLFWLFIIIQSSLYSQRTLGQWNDYLSYQSVFHITKGGTTMYAANQNSLFTYNMDDNSIQRYSSVNGLSDKQITSIQWNDPSSMLIIGYRNGNIDFLTENGVINFSDIKRSNITSGKSINNLYNDGDFTWVSTDFGIVKIDLIAQEVVDTYIIGNGGDETSVSNVIIHEDTVYAATDTGLLKANKNSSLQDFNSWQLVDGLPIVNIGLVFILDGTLGTYIDNGDDQKVYFQENGEWQLKLEDSTIKNILSFNNNLLILRYNWLRVRNSNFEITHHITNYSFTNEESFISAYIDDEDNAWIGDKKWGLVEYINEDQSHYYQPSGPDNNRAWKVDVIDDKIWIAHGGLSETVTARSSKFYFSGSSNGSWSTYRDDEFLVENGVSDIIDVAINPNNTNEVFFGSWNGGLVNKKSDGSLELFHEGKGNSIIHDMENIEGDSPGENFRVGGLTYDNKGNLWVTNSGEGSQNQIIVRKPGGGEVSFDCTSLGTSSKILDIIHTSNNQLWVLNGLSSNGSLFVYDYNETIDNANDDQCMKINTNPNNGALPTNNVVSIAEDLDGEIWIGTSEGPAIIYTPEFLFENNPPVAQQIKIEQDGNVEIVLKTAIISSIAVDGANRKWLGTTNSGAFLLSEDGTDQILHFTTENSPLLDNNIRDISINDKTGEVFFATDEGLFSYTNDATLGRLNNECYPAFPNPVRPDYYGPVVVDGLVRDSQIKITDVYGNLVYETISKGGRMVWNATNFNGDRVQSGVYLALITSIIDSRESSCITKIMVIN